MNLISHPLSFGRTLAAALTAATLLLAGCASDPLPDSNSLAPIETRTPVAAGTVPSGAASAGATSQSSVASVDLTRQGAGAGGNDMLTGAEGRTVYFDFDSYVIKDEYRGVLERQAQRLAAQPSQRATIEGYADDRGGSEYNLALGQKRAESVMRALALLGVQSNRMEAVSFGAERPVAAGSSEEAYAKNRRAEIK